MLKFYGDIIGQNVNEETIYYQGSDTENNYRKQLQTMPKDWYYNNNPIAYTYNKTGHRCKNIEELDFNNYILYIGDSNTEGIGLHVEDTYVYKTSKSLGLDYYNLGLGGTGIEVLNYNLTYWLNTYPAPKFVVLYWSDPARSLCLKENNNKLEFYNVGPWSIQNYNLRFLHLGDSIGYFRARYELLSKSIITQLKSKKIPHYNFTYVPESSLPKFNVDQFLFVDCARDGKHPVFMDVARDGKHPGIISNEQICTKLLEIFHEYNIPR